MRAAYDGIYFDLKRSIKQGTYQYKDLLPSESMLIKQYGCAHNTVRKAIGILAREGYVQPIHGKGVRVIHRSTPLITDRRPSIAPNGIQSFKSSVRHLCSDTSTQILQMENIIAEGEFCEMTGYDPGERLVHLERVRLYDGRPLERESNYFRADMVAGMTQGDAEHSVYDYIERVRGGKIVTCKRVVTIDKTNETDKRLLDMGDINYLANVDVAAYDGDGLLCEITVARYHPEMFTLLQVTTRSRVSQGEE